MNNEPVAWIPKGMTLAKPKDLTDCIPLYTHPAKTLTDKEIAEAKQEALKQYYAINDCAVIQTVEWLDQLFAEAILRKAQEK